MDTARKENVDTGDKMAELDGEDDMIQIVLPSWCNHVLMNNVLWIDSWLLIMRTGKVKTILFDAYSGSIPRLRWYLEGTDSGTYIKLVLSPGNKEKQVKAWGPLDASFVGTWHHVAVTLRMARQYSRTSSDPAVIITQAFLFLDGQHVIEGDAFKTLDLKKDLILESGLSEIFVGGTSPERKSVVFRNLKGAVDNVRVWWPPCPHESDPTKCNPYGFLFPQMKDGTRQPSSGILDDQVQLQHVAHPIQTYMFKLAPADTEGLVAQFSFDNTIVENTVSSSSTWSGPDICPRDGTAVCPGCVEDCTFAKCSLFDTDCVESGATDAAAQAEYAKAGTCQCLNVDDCPRNVELCLCPKDKGLHKVCTRCLVGMCKIYQEPLVLVEPQPPMPPGYGSYGGGYGGYGGYEYVGVGDSGGGCAYTNDCASEGDDNMGEEQTPGNNLGGDQTQEGGGCDSTDDGYCDEPDLCEFGTDVNDCAGSRRRKMLSAEEQAAHESPHEWEVWSNHEYFQNVETQVLWDGETGRDKLEVVPEQHFYYHPATKQTQWHAPKGWNKQKAKAHQDNTPRWSARKLLNFRAEYAGEGRLCHPDTTPAGVGRRSPDYPLDGPILSDCPLDPTQSDGSLMKCERLDPIFCPASMYCTEWDCKCYGAGLNDNTTIAGVLGKTVVDGAKSTLSCGCPTTTYAIDGVTYSAATEETSMPFVEKAKPDGERAMTYECCDDWFDGYQCTLWDSGDPLWAEMSAKFQTQWTILGWNRYT